LTDLAIIQAAQTVALLTVAGAMIYLLNLLRGEVRQAAGILRGVVNTQNEINQNVRRAWERIDAVEARMSAIEERLNRLER
jgi:hypothetical protein